MIKFGSGCYNVEEVEVIREPGGRAGPHQRAIHTTVTFLDDSSQTFELERHARGSDLFEKVCEHLELVEKDYFGLQFVDLPSDSEPEAMRWLDPTKSIRKQMQCPPYVLYFRVKFYVSEPSSLIEEYTRYHLYLQVRKDMREGSLACPESTAALLGSYIAQSEFGDYSLEELGEGYLQTLQIVPNQTPQFLDKIRDLHKLHRGQHPSEAEFNFLEQAKRLPFYGVDLYQAKDVSNVCIQLGVCNVGVTVFQHQQRISTFCWSKIMKLSFKRKNFYIQLRDADGCDTLVCFQLPSTNLCKYCWKSCIEHHTFFRLIAPPLMPQRSLFSLGSRFRYSGRTEYQTIEEMKRKARIERTFNRSGSKLSFSRSSGLRSTVGSERRQSSSYSSVNGDTPQGTPLINSRAHLARMNGYLSSMPEGDTSPLVGSRQPQQQPAAVPGSPAASDPERLAKSWSSATHSTNAPSSPPTRRQPTTMLKFVAPPTSLTIAPFVAASTVDSSGNGNARESRSRVKKPGAVSSYWFSATEAKQRRQRSSDSRLCPTPSTSSASSGSTQRLLRFKRENAQSEAGSQQQQQAGNRETTFGVNGHAAHNDDQNVVEQSFELQLNGRQPPAAHVYSVKPRMNGLPSQRSAAGGRSASTACHNRRPLANGNGHHPMQPGTSNGHSNGSARSSVTSQRSSNGGTNGTNVNANGSVSARAHHLHQNGFTGGADEGLVVIRMRPDAQGRFGFNVKGGADQNYPIIVSKVAPGSPAETCYPRLNEGDQVLHINGRDVTQHTHDQVVRFIRSARESHSGELILTVRPNVYVGEDIDEPDFQYVPSTPHVDDSFARHDLLHQSILLLRDSLSSGAAVLQFDQVYRKKPGMTMDTCRLADNLNKNRYRDVLPYDATRVVIQHGTTGDYINANFVNMDIPTSGIKNRYIASQGPLPHTTGDFWQVVWEQLCSTVVMLTTTVERGRVKCHQYWPRLYETQEYDNLAITCVRENETHTSATREFTLVNKQTKEERRVTQMQYISWPDHGVPDDPHEFIKFVCSVRAARAGSVEPILVHCSAGIGRTGVLILMETAMCLVETNEPVYPLDLTKTMRDQRAMTIQNSSQFKFVCDAILLAYNEGIVKPMADFAHNNNNIASSKNSNVTHNSHKANGTAVNGVSKNLQQKSAEVS